MSTVGTCAPSVNMSSGTGLHGIPFSMQPSQYSLRHYSLVDATITEQRILGPRDLHLQWWQNVYVDDGDEGVVVVRRRFLGRASRRAGAGADIRARTRVSYVVFVIIVIVVMLDPIFSPSFVRKRLAAPLPLDSRT